jgi:hypothetical protein
MVNVSGASFAQSNISSLLVADEPDLIPTDKKVEDRVSESDKDDKASDEREQILVALQQLRPSESELRSHSVVAAENGNEDSSIRSGRSGGPLGADCSVSHLGRDIASKSAMALKRELKSPKVGVGPALPLNLTVQGLESERMKLSSVDPTGTSKKKINISGGGEAKLREESLIQGDVMNDSGRSEPSGLKDKPLNLSMGREVTFEESHHGQVAEQNIGSRTEIGAATLKSENVMMQPVISQSPETIVSDANADGTLLYKFRSWGAEHAVRIVPPALMGADSSSTFLQPSSQLVEQRLNVYGGVTDSGDRWQLREHRDATDEHKEQRSQREREEDDA